VVPQPVPRDEAGAHGGHSLTASERALCRSALWDALALGFRPPDAETQARLLAGEAVAALADAADVLDEGLGAAVRRLGVGTPEALAGAHSRLFGHTARGAVPPYETEYGADSLFQPVHEMSDLVAFYRAFGLTLRSGARERPDHVSCECEFLAFLARKAAWAEEHGDAEMLAATERATVRFLRDHVGRWAPAFGRLLARRDPDGLYGALGRLCVEVVAVECARLGVPAGPDVLRLRSAALPAVPAACGE
jgi:DMSO reductase family type II enzyme chaperone